MSVVARAIAASVLASVATAWIVGRVAPDADPDAGPVAVEAAGPTPTTATATEDDELTRVRAAVAACRAPAAPTMEGRFAAGAVDAAATAAFRARLAPIEFGAAEVDDVACRGSVCALHVTTADDQSPGRWHGQLQALAMRALASFRIGTIESPPGYTTSEFMVEFPGGGDPLGGLAAVIAQVERGLADGVAGCAHGEALVTFTAQGGAVQARANGTPCVHAALTALLRDGRSTGDAFITRGLRW